MCMSPHEMSSESIEGIVNYWKQKLEVDPDYAFAKRRIEEFEKILKERAEAGTYDDDFTDRSGNATARQGRGL